MVLVLLLLLLLPALAQETLTPAHVARLRSVSTARLSPDGRWVAFVHSVPRNPGVEDGNPYGELHVLDKETRRPFVTGKINVGQLGFRAEAVTYVAKRSGDETACLYEIPTDGGESRKLVGFKTDLRGYSFSPDGKRVAFLALEPLPEKLEKQRKKGFNQQVYEEDWRPTRIYTTRIGGEPTLLSGEGSASQLHWSPDGQHLAVALAPDPGVDADLMLRRVHILDANSGKVVAKVENPGKLGQVEWSPDGKRLALISGADLNDPADGRLMIVPATGGKPVDILPNLEAHVQRVAWISPTRLRVLIANGLESDIWEVDADGTDRRDLGWTGAVFQDLDVSADGKSTVLVGESPQFPGEVFLAGGQPPHRVTHSNPWLDKARLAKQQTVTWKARDGLSLQGVLVRPLDEVPGQRYPLIMCVHGGPEAREVNGWMTGYSTPGQVAAARGFAVFYPNYRGSTGRGVAFSKLGQGDPAGKEFDDLVDAVDHLVASGLVDKAKVGITGGSYGGYASAWGATHYSDRYAASVMFVGISDTLSKFGTTDIPREEFLVHARRYPWDDWNLMLERSPIREVQKGHTPLLIMHGRDDPRVHPSQSLELYRYVKTLGQAPVRLVLYPGEGHGNRRAASRLDYNLRMLQWFEHYLKGPGGAPPPYELEYPEITE